MKIEHEIVRKIIDEILSDRVNQRDIDMLSFFLYPHTTKYKRMYHAEEVPDNIDIDVNI
jgi:hypothetical protein